MSKTYTIPSQASFPPPREIQGSNDLALDYDQAPAGYRTIYRDRGALGATRLDTPCLASVPVIDPDDVDVNEVNPDTHNTWNCPLADAAWNGRA